MNNWKIAMNRANTVLKLLTENGIPNTLIKAIPYGPSSPIVPNEKDEEDRSKNRRLEIVIEF